MMAPGLDTNLDHELSRDLQSCDVVNQSDSVGLVNATVVQRARPISARARGAFTRISGRFDLSELHIKPRGGLEVVDWIVFDNWHAELHRYCDIFGQAPPHAEIEWQE